MPSPYPRIGIVVDEDVGDALRTVREQAGRSLPSASIAREAVFEGAALSAVLNQAKGGSPRRHAAAQLLHELRALLMTASLPEGPRRRVIAAIDAALDAGSAAERQHRQRALLSQPDPYAQVAIEVTESIDAFDTAGH